MVPILVHPGLWNTSIFGQKLPIRTAQHMFLKRRYSEVTEKLYHVLSTSRSQVPIILGSSFKGYCQHTFYLRPSQRAMVSDTYLRCLSSGMFHVLRYTRPLNRNSWLNKSNFADLFAHNAFFYEAVGKSQKPLIRSFKIFIWIKFLTKLLCSKIKPSMFDCFPFIPYLFIITVQCLFQKWKPRSTTCFCFHTFDSIDFPL